MAGFRISTPLEISMLQEAMLENHNHKSHICVRVWTTHTSYSGVGDYVLSPDVQKLFVGTQTCTEPLRVNVPIIS